MYGAKTGLQCIAFPSLPSHFAVRERRGEVYNAFGFAGPPFCALEAKVRGDKQLSH